MFYQVTRASSINPRMLVQALPANGPHSIQIYLEPRFNHTDPHTVSTVAEIDIVLVGILPGYFHHSVLVLLL